MRPCSQSDAATEKLLPFPFLMKEKYLLSLIFLPEMQKCLKREEPKGTSLPLLRAMGKQVPVLFALRRSLYFPSYLCPPKAQRTIPGVRPREFVYNLVFPPSWKELQWQISLRLDTSWFSITNGYCVLLEALWSIIPRKMPKCIRWIRNLTPLFVSLKQRWGRSTEIAVNKREIIYYKCIQYGKYIRILLKADVPAWNIKSILERGRRKSM